MAKVSASPKRVASPPRARQTKRPPARASATRTPMTDRRPAPSSNTPRRQLWPWIRIGAELRRDIVAVATFVAVVLTLWGLAGEHGGILGYWSAALHAAFGWAAVLVPLAALGWVADSFRQHPVAPFGPRQRHIAGTVLVLAAVLGLLHLGAPNAREWGETGRGGGYLGYLISLPLILALRPIGASIVLLGLATVGLVIALNTNLRALGAAFSHAVVGLRARWRRKPRPAPFAPALGAAPLTAPERIARDGEAGAVHAATQAGPVINMPAIASDTTRPTATAHVQAAGPLVLGAGQLPLLSPPDAPARYDLPPVEALPLYDSVLPNRAELDKKARRIEQTLAAFKVEARVREINPGAAVTQFALEPGPGVPVRRIKALENDLALALAAAQINIETPIPGQPRVGIVIPNSSIAVVGLRETMESKEFGKAKAKLPVALGRDVNGRYIVADLTKMPHLLIAGSTGSGKSVCLNSIISTFLLSHNPDDLKLVMIDPKMVELVGYNGIPHLKSPVIVEMDKVVGTLRKALAEMERRYQLFSKLQVRNIDGYYARRTIDPSLEQLPYLVVIIDELADLMMTAPDEVETVLVRLAQMARATGIHLIIATQRPSVDVLTGLIKANFPARIAFAVTSQVDSRVILDAPGAERLLGRGDMLFQDPNTAKPVRVQGTFVHDRDIEALVAHWRKALPDAQYDSAWLNVPLFHPHKDGDEEETDPLLVQAQEIVRQHGTASASMLQRRLRVGYNRAARLIEQMEEDGFIGPSEGARGRTLLQDDAVKAESPDDVPFDDD